LKILQIFEIQCIPVYFSTHQENTHTDAVSNKFSWMRNLQKLLEISELFHNTA